MKNKQEINDNLIDLLLKKAEGFHYQEEQFEYERDKSSKNSSTCQNLNFFDLCDRGEQVFIDDGDKLKSANGKKIQGDEELILVKKKVTTHYIPPDMLAIKILFEIYGKEIEYDNLNTLTDEELLDLKNKLIKEISNEN